MNHRPRHMTHWGITVWTALALALCAIEGGSAPRVEPAFNTHAVLNSFQPQGRVNNLYGTTGAESNPAIARGGDGVWITTWHSSDNQDGRVGKDWDIFYSRSTDNGASWSADAVVNSNADADTGADLSPAVLSDGKNTWVIAWTSTESFTSSLSRDRDIRFARSIDNGATWSSPAPLNVNAAQDYGNDWGVRLATDSQGNWVAVWASTDSLTNRVGGDSDIFVSRSRDNGATWTHPIPLNNNATADVGFDSTPEVATDGEGGWIAVWSSGDPLGGRLGTERDIFVSKSQDLGATWTDPVPLNRNAASDDNNDWTPSIASGGDGKWVTVWASADTLGGVIGFDRDLLVSRSNDDGETWTRPKPIDANAKNDAQEDSSPSVIADRKGQIMAVWHSWSAFSEYGQADADVVVAFSQDNGETWSPPKPINRDAGSDAEDDTLPRIATDMDGNWVAVWQTYSVSGGSGADPSVTSAWRVNAARGELVASEQSEAEPAAPAPLAQAGASE